MELLNRLNNREAVIGVLGLGYVGLPLMLRFSDVGYQVLGFDIDPAKVDALNAGRSYIEHISAEATAKAVGRGFNATTDFSRARDCDALILCVPTPLNQYREPDLNMPQWVVSKVADALNERGKAVKCARILVRRQLRYRYQGQHRPFAGEPVFRADAP